MKSDKLWNVVFVFCIILLGMTLFMGFDTLISNFNEYQLLKQEQAQEIIQQEVIDEFYPVEYQIITCNVAGFEGQFDYIIQISTRDKSEVERIIKRLHGGSNE